MSFTLASTSARRTPKQTAYDDWRSDYPELRCSTPSQAWRSCQLPDGNNPPLSPKESSLLAAAASNWQPSRSPLVTVLTGSAPSSSDPQQTTTQLAHAALPVDADGSYTVRHILLDCPLHSTTRSDTFPPFLAPKQETADFASSSTFPKRSSDPSLRAQTPLDFLSSPTFIA